MIEKKIEVDGKEMTLRSSALIPRLYRAYIGRDVVRDMRRLADSYKRVNELREDATEEERAAAQFDAVDLEVFENIAWIMLKHGGEDVGEDPDTWLLSLDGAFSVYEILPTILELWNFNNRTTSKPVKK